MNTYRVILLNTADLNNLKTETVFFQATKYNDAWTGARAVLAGKEEAKERKFFTNDSCTDVWTLDADINGNYIFDSPRYPG